MGKAKLEVEYTGEVTSIRGSFEQCTKQDVFNVLAGVVQALGLDGSDLVLFTILYESAPQVVVDVAALEKAVEEGVV
jgi:hypothetical protein